MAPRDIGGRSLGGRSLSGRGLDGQGGFRAPLGGVAAPPAGHFFLRGKSDDGTYAILKGQVSAGTYVNLSGQ